MTNYEKALELMDKGMAYEHHTFKDTGYLVLDLGGEYAGYIAPDDENVDMARNNVHIGYGIIDMDKMVVHDTANRFELPIKAYADRVTKCVDKRPIIKKRGR